MVMSWLKLAKNLSLSKGYKRRNAYLIAKIKAADIGKFVYSFLDTPQ